MSQFQIFGDGQQTRDFIYIEDVLTALNLVATKSEALGHVYNVGTEVAISLNQLIEEMNQLVGLSFASFLSKGTRWRYKIFSFR